MYISYKRPFWNWRCLYCNSGDIDCGNHSDPCADSITARQSYISVNIAIRVHYLLRSVRIQVLRGR
ncbi:hypothetical protein J6590_036973 [Homalodisca vitripennis]|nr:hypothetical protein J6590_036973 [Homalodisca vitripennis]